MNRSVALAGLAMLVIGCDQLVTSPSRYTAVEVHTERRDGTAVPNVPLVLYTGLRIMGYDTTNAQGVARFVRVPEGPAYGVYAGEPAGYAFPEQLLGGPPTNAVNGLDLVHGSIANVTSHLLRIGPGTVVTRITDDAGSPVASADVDLYTATGVLQRSKTATDGRAVFSAVPYGLYGVRTVRTAAYRDLEEPEFLWKDGLLVEEGGTVDASLALERCQGTINVHVVDPARGDAAGVATYLFMRNGILDSTRTASDGRVKFAVPMCGDFGVRIVGNADWRVTPGRGTEFADGLIINRGTTRDVTFPVQYNSCRGAVRVTIVDGSGVMVSGASVVLYTAGTAASTTMMASDGMVTFSDLACAPPERGVRVIPPAGWSVAPNASDHADGLVVTNGGVLDVRFTLARTSP